MDPMGCIEVSYFTPFITIVGGPISMDPHGIDLLGGETSNIFYFHPYLGKISNLTNIYLIFFKGVGSTTNQD